MDERDWRIAELETALRDIRAMPTEKNVAGYETLVREDVLRVVCDALHCDCAKYSNASDCA